MSERQANRAGAYQVLAAREEDLLALGRPAERVHGALGLRELRAEHAVARPRLDLPVLAAGRERLSVVGPAQRRHRAAVSVRAHLLDASRLVDELERSVGAAEGKELGALAAVERREPSDFGTVLIGIEQLRLRLALHVPHPHLFVIAHRDQLIGARPADAGDDLTMLLGGVLRDEETHHAAAAAAEGGCTRKTCPPGGPTSRCGAAREGRAEGALAVGGLPGSLLVRERSCWTRSIAEACHGAKNENGGKAKARSRRPRLLPSCVACACTHRVSVGGS